MKYINKISFKESFTRVTLMFLIFELSQILRGSKRKVTGTNNEKDTENFYKRESRKQNRLSKTTFYSTNGAETAWVPKRPA